MRRALALLLALGACPPAEARVHRDRRGPKVSPLAPEDWLRHPCDDKTYQESWTAILRSDAGHVLYVSFLYTNLGVLSGSAALAVSITRPGGQAQALRFDHDAGDFRQDAKAGRIAIGDSSMTLHGGRLDLVLREEGLSADLSLRAWMPGVKLYDGRVWLDNERTEYVDLWFHVPRGDLSGTLTMGGRREELKGAGYVDHLAQTTLSPTYSTRWWTVRLFAPDHTVDLLAWKAPKSMKGVVISHLLVTDRTRVLALDDAVELRPGRFRDDPKGHRYATRFDLSWKGRGLELKGDVTSRRLQERDAVLDRLSWVERKVAGLVAGNPVVYRMEGEAHLRLTRDGAAVPVVGAALMESLVLGEDE